MPTERSQDIPCSECDDFRDNNIDPFPHREYVRCDPIPERPDWCRIVWLDNS